MYGSCFLIHSAIPCVLLGAFNPFTFKVLLIGIYSLPFFHTCVPLCFTVFLPVLKTNPLASPAEMLKGLDEVYSLRLLLSGKLLIWPSILIESLAV